MEARMTYIGILDGSGNVWGVRIPDIPGCVGAGATAEAAIADATKALRDVAEYKTREGYKLSAPSPLAVILASGEVGAGETTVEVPLRP